MTCPKCAHEKTRVYGTIKGLYTIRFRRCQICGHTFKTKEAVYADRLNLEYVEYMRDIGEYDDEDQGGLNEG